MGRFTNGWVKIYREAIDGDIGTDTFRLGVFVKLVGWANRKEGNAELAGQRSKLQPGQIVTGLRELSPDRILDPYLHRVRSALDYLETRGTIAQATSNRGRIITLCNWERYQSPEDQDCKPDASHAQAARKPGASQAQLIGERRREKEEGRKKRESAVALPRLAEIWNENRGSLPEVRGCSGTRRKHADLRWREEPSAEYWARVVQRISRSPFCSGDNERNWRADFDFLIRPETRHKVEEGKYDPRRERGFSTHVRSLEERQEAENWERIRRQAVDGTL